MSAPQFSDIIRKTTQVDLLISLTFIVFMFLKSAYFSQKDICKKGFFVFNSIVNIAVTHMTTGTYGILPITN